MLGNSIINPEPFMADDEKKKNSASMKSRKAAPFITSKIVGGTTAIQVRYF